MRRSLAFTLILTSGAATAQAVPSGPWDVTSTVVDLKIPGVPGFVQRMIRGRARAEHKHLIAGQGIEALLSPDPKAQCHVDAQQIAGGRYAQTLSCPQKHGGPLRITRSGTYDATGFAGTAMVTGSTTKGAMSITLDQRAARAVG